MFEHRLAHWLFSARAERAVRRPYTRALAVSGGRIIAFDNGARLKERYRDAQVIAIRVSSFQGLSILMFIFSACYGRAHGESLLDWLTRYTFPAELAFDDHDYAAARAQQFVRMLGRAGTTSALIFGVSFEDAMQQLFSAMKDAKMAGASGLVWMDREGPEGLLRSAQSCLDASSRLLHKFCNNGHLRYALLPRFAPLLP